MLNSFLPAYLPAQAGVGQHPVEILKQVQDDDKTRKVS